MERRDAFHGPHHRVVALSFLLRFDRNLAGVLLTVGSLVACSVASHPLDLAAGDKTPGWRFARKPCLEPSDVPQAPPLANLQAEAVAARIAELSGNRGDAALIDLVRIGHNAVEPLIQQLGSRDPKVRRLATAALGFIGEPEAVPPLHRLTLDSDAKVRAGGFAALIALLQSCSGNAEMDARSVLVESAPLSVEPLIEALRTGDRHERASVPDVLWRIKDARVLDPLILAVSDSDPDVRRRAATALGYRRDARASRALLQVLADNDEFARAAAAGALGSLADTANVEALIKATSDPSLQVRIAALGSLTSLADNRGLSVMIGALNDQSDVVRFTAAQGLGFMKDSRAAQPLIRLLHDPEESVRDVAMHSLGRLRAVEAAGPLIALLSDSSGNVRSSAAEVLGKLHDTSAVVPMIRALADERPFVRQSAVTALGLLGDKRAVDPLITMLADRVSYVRLEAAKALGMIADSRALPPLVALLSDSDEVTRVTAAASLGLIGDPIAVDPLLKTLGDKSPWVRATAACALGEIGDTRALKSLEILQTDSSESTRGWAARGVEELHAPTRVQRGMQPNCATATILQPHLAVDAVYPNSSRHFGKRRLTSQRRGTRWKRIGDQGAGGGEVARAGRVTGGLRFGARMAGAEPAWCPRLVTLRRGRGRRPGIREAFADGVDHEVQPFERARSEDREVIGFTEHHLVGRHGTGRVNSHFSRPALDHRAARLPETLGLDPLDEK